MVQGLSLWKGTKKSKTWEFQDKKASEIIKRAGSPMLCYRYIGPFVQDPNDPYNNIPSNANLPNELTIQDVILGENRDISKIQYQGLPLESLAVEAIKQKPVSA